MKVLIVAPKGFPDIRVEHEATTLAQEGHEVTVLANARFSKPSKAPFPIKYFWLASPIQVLALIPLFLKEFREADVIHVCDTLLALLAVPLAKLLGKKAILDFFEIRSLVFAYDWRFHPFLKAFGILATFLGELVGSHLADFCVVVTEYALRALPKRYRANRSKFVVVGNAVDPSKVPRVKPSDEFVLCYFGNLNSGLLLLGSLISSLRHVRDIPVKLRIVGDGMLREPARKLAEKLGVLDKVEFTGFVPDEKLPDVLPASLYIDPYWACEPRKHVISWKFSIYMALGRPSIAPKVGDFALKFADVVVFWDPQTPEKLAEILRWAYQNPKSLESLGKKAREKFLSEYNWNKESLKLKALYKALSRL